MPKRKKTRRPQGPRAKGANLESLGRAARRAKRSSEGMLTPIRLSSQQAHPALLMGDKPKRRDRNDAVVKILARPAKPRQPSLRLGGGSPLRGVTVTALATPKARRKAARSMRMREAAREAICNDYRREREARRGAMFANGSAGKGRRNKGPRQLDWRAEFC